jgi:hypothetical protein
MKNGVFWDVTLRGSCKNPRFGDRNASLIIVTSELTWYFFAACVGC